jgi:integration host factor subunit beta
MVKSELVRVLSEKLPDLQPRDVELAVNCMLEQMLIALENGTRIEVRGFGSFDLRHHAPRTRRNPKTGEILLDGSATVKPYFKPGKELRDRVDASRTKCRITE